MIGSAPTMTYDEKKKEWEQAINYQIPVEDLHPTIQKLLKGRLDALYFRQIQGEFAKYYRYLRNFKNVAKMQNFPIKMELIHEWLDITNAPEAAQVDTLHINTTKGTEEKPLSQTAIDEIFLKHLDNALEEVKNMCLGVILAEMKEVSDDVHNTEIIQKLIEVKKKLEGRSSDNTSVEDEITDLFHKTETVNNEDQEM